MIAARFIAIVDNDPGVRTAVVRLLRAHGFRAQGFASAEAFLARDSSERPDCLLLDINLAGMSGIELLRLLQAHGTQLPAVVMTAADDEIRRRGAVAAGCVSFLSKPSCAERLLAAIEEAMRSSEPD